MSDAPERSGTWITPGAGLRQGRVRGINAGHLGLQAVLKSAVSENGELLFDRLDSVLNMDLLEQTIEIYSSSELPSEPRDQLVFYCNAYNANALAILTMLAIDSSAAMFREDEPMMRVRSEAGAPAPTGAAGGAAALRDRFDAQPVQIANETLTMSALCRERILGFRDPRVLAYLIDVDVVNAPLPRESLWPERMDDQLDAMCMLWVNTGSLATVADGELRLDPALERHASDFEVDTFGGVLGFLQRYADPNGPLRAALDREATAQ